MTWAEPETWIALALAFGLGAGSLKGGKALYRRYSTRPPRRPRQRRNVDVSLEPPPYRSDKDSEEED